MRTRRCFGNGCATRRARPRGATGPRREPRRPGGSAQKPALPGPPRPGGEGTWCGRVATMPGIVQQAVERTRRAFAASVPRSKRRGMLAAAAIVSAARRGCPRNYQALQRPDPGHQRHHTSEPRRGGKLWFRPELSQGPHRRHRGDVDPVGVFELDHCHLAQR